jgi:DNA polymerase-3 subunit delta
MTAAQVRAAIAAGDVRPIYLIEGEDGPSRFDLAQAFLELVDEGLRAFNVALFHGRDAATANDREAMLAGILGAARTLPMMAPRRVILVHDADVLLAPRRTKDDEGGEPPSPAARKRARTLTAAEEFEAYVASPEPLTALVLDARKLDRGRRVAKLLVQHAVVVNCDDLRTLADVTRWLAARLDRDEMRIEPAAVTALMDAVGWLPPAEPRGQPRIDIGRIRSEIEKLVLYAAGESTITARHVRDVVTPDDDPEGEWALSRAIEAGQAAAALRELGALIEAGTPAPLALGQIRAAVIRLRPDARARAALRAVLETDLAVKSSRGEPRHVLERLVVEVCGGMGAASAGAARRAWTS